MVGEKKEPQAQPQPINIQPVTPTPNSLQISDIVLVSNNMDIDQLSSYMVWLMQQPAIKDYLSLIKKQKANEKLMLGVQ